jgi:uncharacterized protein (DUF488 family)
MWEEASAQTGSGTPRILTIGHSTRPLSEFITILEGFGVCRLVDVRTVPRSRTNPQFNRDTLPGELEKTGIGYAHMAGLGGLRRPRAGSTNLGWRNLSFRGYADYMLSEEFEQNLSELIALASREQIAIMCAEAVPWRCHRSLIGDALLARGVHVDNIMGPHKATPHKLTPFAKVEGSRVTYPGQTGPGSGRGPAA